MHIGIMQLTSWHSCCFDIWSFAILRVVFHSSSLPLPSLERAYRPSSAISPSNTPHRFVTGYLDTQIDLTRDRPSWFPPGKNIQPPVQLLEVRHCIVHRHMPSLAELKRATQQALDWLWEWYWSQLEPAFGLPTSVSTNGLLDNDTGVTDKLQNILKTYVKGRKSEIKAKRRGDVCTSASTAVSTYTLRFSASATSLPSSMTQDALIQLLVEEKQILPADKKLGSSMSGAFLVWNSLLLAFCGVNTAFFQSLLDAVMKAMNDVELRDEEREGMCEWAAHMLCSSEWRDARGGQERAIREKVLGNCMTELGMWNLRLAEKIVDSMETGEAELWRAILDASQGGLEEDESMIVDEDEQTKEQVRDTQDEGRGRDMEVVVDVEKVVEAMPVSVPQPAPVPQPIEVGEKIQGPQKVVGLWKPKPIGWLPEGWDEDA